MNYSEIYSRLCYDIALIIFYKKNGDLRIMLGTRNLHSARLEYPEANLGYQDNRCNSTNGNVAVFDLIIGEPRQFNVGRLVKIEFLGEVRNSSDFGPMIEKYRFYKDYYEKLKNDVSESGSPIDKMFN